MTDREKYDRYLEKHPWDALFMTLRQLIFIALSIWTAYMAIMAALEGEWNKGIFFLVLMATADKALRELLKERRKKIE